MDGMQPGGEGPQDPTARADWASSADGGGGVAAPPAASPNMPDAEHAPGAAPQVSEQQQQPQTVPVAVTPLKRGGLLGVMDSIGDALVGRTRPELGKDPDGNMYIKDVTLSHGAQWRRIAGEAMAGAAAGLAAGRGAGNTGKAAVAGIQAGQQIQDRDKQNINDQINQDDKIMLSNANRQMLRMNFAEKAWEAARKGVKATQEDIEFNQKQEDRYVAQGGKILGRVADPSQIGEVLKVNPDLAQDLVKRHLIELTQHINPDGTAGGFSVIKMPDKYRDQFLPSGATFHTFNETTGQIEEHHSSDPMTVGDRDDYDTAAGLAQMKWRTAKADQDAKAAQAQKDLGDATKVPSEIERNQASAQRDRAEAGQLSANTPGASGNPANLSTSSGNAAADDELSKWPAATQSAVMGLTNYEVDPASFPTRRMAKGNEMPRETAVGLAKMIDPSFDEKQWNSRKKALQEWSDPQKAGGTLISLNQAIQHLGELRKGIDQLHNSHFWLWNKGANALKSATDNPAIAAFDTPRQGLMNEMAAVFKKTAGTDQEIKAWGNTMDRATGHNNQVESSNKMLDLMVGRIDAMHDQFRRAMGRDPDQPFIGPQAAAVLEKMGPEGKKLVERDRAQVRQKPQAAAKPARDWRDRPQPGEQPMASARPNAAPQSAAFSKSAWLRANPGGDVNAAVQAAQAAGHPVID